MKLDLHEAGLNHIKLPLNAVRVFKSNIKLLQCFIKFHTCIFNSRITEAFSYAVKFFSRFTSHRQMICSNSKRIKLCIIFSLFKNDKYTAYGKCKQFRCFKKNGKTNNVL